MYVACPGLEIVLSRVGVFVNILCVLFRICIVLVLLFFFPVWVCGSGSRKSLASYSILRCPLKGVICRLSSCGCEYGYIAPWASFSMFLFPLPIFAHFSIWVVKFDFLYFCLALVVFCFFCWALFPSLVAKVVFPSIVVGLFLAFFGLGEVFSSSSRRVSCGCFCTYCLFLHAPVILVVNCV